MFITLGGQLLRRHWRHVRPHQADAGLDIRVDDMPELEDSSDDEDDDDPSDDSSDDRAPSLC